MGRAAFTVAGTVVGAYFGQPALGAAIGGAIGGLAFPPPDTYGPTIDDTSIAPGTYGQPIGSAYGLSDMGCDLIWVEGNEIKVRTNKQSSKGGPSVVTSEAFASFALLISDRPITGLRRLYFGKELVYDGTAEGLQPAVEGGSPAVGGVPLSGAIDGLQFRLYTGTSDQEPDPLIQAEDANASAYRGMAYIVVEDLPLAQFGNGIPGDRLPVIAEVTTSDPVSLTFTLPTYDYSVSQGQFATFDPTRGRMISSRSNRGSVKVYDILTGTLERIDDPSGTTHPWRHTDFGDLSNMPLTIGATTPGSGSRLSTEVGPVFSPDGALYVIHERWTSIAAGFGVLMDAETGQYLGVIGQGDAGTFDAAFSFGHGPNNGVSTISNYHIIREVDWLPIDPITGLQSFLYMIAVENGWLYFAQISSANRERIGSLGFVDISDWDAATTEFYFQIDKAGSRIFCAYRSAGNARVAISQISGFRDGAIDPAGADAYGLDTIVDLSTMSPTADPGSIAGCIWNEDAATFTVVGEDGFVILDENLNVIFQQIEGWTVDGDAGGYAHMSNIEQDRFWVTASSIAAGDEKDTVRAYSTEDGSLLETLDLTDWGLSDDFYLTPFWRYRFDIYVANGLNAPRLLFGDRFGLDKIPLSTVLLDTAQRTGVTSGDLDLTQVTRLIYGAPQKAANASARGAWDDLLLLTDHYAAMIDGVLTVQPRETVSSGTLTDDDLSADGKPELLRRTNSAAPPRRIEISYKSVPANLEPATQADEFPIEVLSAGRTVKLQTALRMDDDEAWGAVQRLLADLSTERTEMEIALPYTRGDIEPGEIWGITSGAEVYPMRLVEISGGRVMKLKGTAAYPFLTPSATPIDSGRPPPVLAQLSSTDFALIDAHAWKDEFNGPEFAITAWQRRASLQWNGGVILKSADPVAFTDEFATLTVASISAQATAALGDVPDPDAGFDLGNTINVRMIAGTPSSATEAQVLLGSNPIWVECGASGEWELVQFATATEESDGTFTLSKLLRGRRGTEHLTGIHANADRVIWADETTAVRKGGANIGTQFYYLSSSIGKNTTQQDISTRRGFTNRGRALQPYSVVDVAGTRNGSGDLVITWARRSRIHGSVENTTPPLGEATEAYEIDILNAIGSPTGAVVRPLTATSETVTYTAAQQAADFGSPSPDLVTVAIYQISADVGRGVVREATL